MIAHFFPSRSRRAPRSDLFPYTTLFRSRVGRPVGVGRRQLPRRLGRLRTGASVKDVVAHVPAADGGAVPRADGVFRSEEHTSELQSPCNLVCRLLLEQKNFKTY